MRIILIIIIGIFLPNKGFSQCESFSENFFQLVKNQDYESIEDYLMTVEQHRKIMHWPNNSDANATLKEIRDSLKVKLKRSIEELRELKKADGLNLSKGKYLGCSRSEGVFSTITIFFKIKNNIDSFYVQTIQTNQIYINLPITYKKTPIELSSSAFTIIEGQKYRIFKPRPDEIQKAKTQIQGRIMEENVILHCINGYINESEERYLKFIKIQEGNPNAIELLYDMERLTFREINKE